MRVVLQRVKRAEVRVESRVTGRIGPGFLVLAGFAPTDTETQLAWMAEKILGLRLFGDAEGKMNLDLDEAGGGLLIVSQFTLYGDARKGRRPAYFPEAGGYVETPVYDRYGLQPGSAFAGPAIIEERESTTIVGPGARIRVDATRTLIAEPA